MGDARVLVTMATLLIATGCPAPEPNAVECDRFCQGYYRCTGSVPECEFLLSEGEVLDRCNDECPSIAGDMAELQIDEAVACLDCFYENAELAGCTSMMLYEAVNGPCQGLCAADGAVTYMN